MPLRTRRTQCGAVILPLPAAVLAPPVVVRRMASTPEEGGTFTSAWAEFTFSDSRIINHHFRLRGAVRVAERDHAGVDVAVAGDLLAGETKLVGSAPDVRAGASDGINAVRVTGRARRRHGADDAARGKWPEIGAGGHGELREQQAIRALVADGRLGDFPGVILRRIPVAVGLGGLGSWWAERPSVMRPGPLAAMRGRIAEAAGPSGCPYSRHYGA